MSTTYPCSRCEGKGKIAAFSHVIGGTCLKCGGTGRQKSKPATKGVKYGVFGFDRSTGAAVNLYWITAANPAKAVARATVTYQGASTAFKDQYTMDGAFARPAAELED